MTYPRRIDIWRAARGMGRRWTVRASSGFPTAPSARLGNVAELELPLEGDRAAVRAPTVLCEAAARSRGARWIAGVDEAGRGALAGPVVAAAVVLPLDLDGAANDLAAVRDSKDLAPDRRAELVPVVVGAAERCAIGAAWPSEIDALGIARAGELAMRRALASIRTTLDLVLVDGFAIRGLDAPQRSIVKGDRTVLSIAAASILAKVARDAWMIRLDSSCPGYRHDRHKGYGSPEHLRALTGIGPSRHHRLSWRPVAAPAPKQLPLPMGDDRPTVSRGRHGPIGAGRMMAWLDPGRSDGASLGLEDAVDWLADATDDRMGVRSRRPSADVAPDV